MKIGELARQTGMAASAIRFYEARACSARCDGVPTAIATTRPKRCSC
ncbi:MerR family transcriptional regulator [Aeromonas rivipollensis]